jgi:cell division protein FtsW
MGERSLTAEYTGQRGGLDWPVASTRISLLAIALVCLGLVMVASAGSGNAGSAAGFRSAALRRGMWICCGMVAFLIAAWTNYQWWRRHSLLVLAGAVVALMLVLVPGIGTKVNGARRWIRIGGLVSVQPSEFAKLAVCIWLAAYAERQTGEMKSALRGFVIPFSVVGLVSALVLLEPDFGTSMLIGAIGTGVLLVCGTRPLYVILAGLAMLPAVQELVLGTPYRRERLMIFLNPWRDPQGAGYQLIQSKIATGSGGLTGLGLGYSAQKLRFLPGARNDFIFSVIAEELGFLGATVVILLFLWFVWEGIKVALRARDKFGFALATGLSIFIGLQAVINIAVISGSVPPKGLSLPFISAGGSSLFVSMFAAGVLVNIARTVEESDAFELKPWHADVPEYEHEVADIARDIGSVLKRKITRKWGSR